MGVYVYIQKHFVKVYHLVRQKVGSACLYVAIRSFLELLKLSFASTHESANTTKYECESEPRPTISDTDQALIGYISFQARQRTLHSPALPALTLLVC